MLPPPTLFLLAEPTAAERLDFVRSVLNLASEFKYASAAVVLMVIVFGVPEVGSPERPWVRRRGGVLDAYVDRTNVFRSFGERLDKVERSIELHSQVMLAIASQVGINVAQILAKLLQRDPAPSSAAPKGGTNPVP